MENNEKPKAKHGRAKCDGLDVANFFYCLLELADHNRVVHGHPGTTVEAALRFVREATEEGYMEEMLGRAEKMRQEKGCPSSMLMKVMEATIEEVLDHGEIDFEPPTVEPSPYTHPWRSNN